MASPKRSVSVKAQDIHSQVFLTDEHTKLERMYLCRLSQNIHRIVVKELDSEEESLFLMFSEGDANMNGSISQDEIKKVVEQVGAEASADELQAIFKAMDLNGDGTVSFIELLKWWHGELEGDGAAGALKEKAGFGFKARSFAVGAAGSGVMGSDERLAKLEVAGLKENITGYKRILMQISEHKMLKKLAETEAFEQENGLTAATLNKYLGMLQAEFEDDMALLFDIFCEVDKSGDFLVDGQEVKTLIKLLDSEASEADVEKYLEDVAMDNGALTYALFVSWWDHVLHDASGIVAEKGTILQASIKARSIKSKGTALFHQFTQGDHELMTLWRDLEASEPQKLSKFKEGFKRAILECRRYKMAKHIKQAERTANLYN
eukprot:TRINITY_DN40215_c0_g1_i1.p1 TRINITY_DN40215_c0_g1~~TRINITY_DN40215_c0_g1_i1.p1  ORF type:complete len:377 (+),score=115.48 TRINITY_DN40215_c0_g1_i1:61-1191(+)